METDKRAVIERKAEHLTVKDKIPVNSLPLSDSIEIEEVLKTLGVWEKAVVLHERGLTWSQVAATLISAGER